MPENYSYLYDTYSLIKNVDQSVLLLNSVTKDYGYEIVEIGLDEFEANFSALFNIQNEFDKSKVKQIHVGHYRISEAFYDAISLDSRFGVGIYSYEKVFLLKRIESGKQEVIRNSMGKKEMYNILGNMAKFITSLIHQIRLLKKGDIYFNTQFQIIQDSRTILSQIKDLTLRVIGNTIIHFTEEDIAILKSRFKEDFSSTGLTELALSNYNLSYEISDLKTKYMVLMSGIESLFNLGKDQITHTVSRHLALINVSTAEDFQKEYKRNKHLYNIRSTIVHGDNQKDFTAELEEVQEKLRKAINYCLDNKDIINKNQLFDLLNCKGF